MDTFLLIAILVALVILIMLGVVGVSRITQKQDQTNNQLSSLHQTEDKTGGTVLLPVTKMDPKAECNTVLPLPIGAEMCAHKMEPLVTQKISAPHEERVVIICQCTKCGAIDKTIAVTSPPPPPPPPPPRPPEPRSECRHQWVKEKSVTLESAFEQMEEVLKQQQNAKKKVTYDPKKKNSGEEEQETPVFDPATAPPWMFQKKHIRERICSKCGEVDRVVTSNFEVDEECSPTET